MGRLKMEMEISSCSRDVFSWGTVNRPVSFNIFSSILHVAQPLGPVGHEELLDQILRHGVNVTGPVYLPAEDLLVDPEGIVVKERRVAGQHLIDEDAEGPPVHRLVVALRLDDLGRQVLRGPAQGPGPVCHLKQNSVSDFN